MLRITIRPSKVLSEAALFDLPDAHLTLERYGDGFTFDLYRANKTLGGHDRIGFIDIGPNRQFEDIWNVRNVGVDRDGFGPALYEVAMEFCQFLGAKGLSPDRHTVSPFAENVWQKYDARDDVIKSPLPEGYRQSQSHPSVLRQVFSKERPNYLNSLISSGKLVDNTGVLVS